MIQTKLSKIKCYYKVNHFYCLRLEEQSEDYSFVNVIIINFSIIIIIIIIIINIIIPRFIQIGL